MNKAIWLNFLFLTFSFTTMSQNCNGIITGKVIDEHDEAGLDYASIQIKQSTIGVIASADGSFALTDICPGLYTLVVSHIGCTPVEYVLQFTKDTHVVFYLEHHVELLEEVKVKAEAQKMSVQSLQSKVKVEQLHLINTANLAQAIEGLPGVSLLSSGPTIGKPILNGLSGVRVGVLQNGILIEGQSWGEDHGPEVDIHGSDNVRVIRGPAAVRYGSSSIGGIVALEQESLLLADSITHVDYTFNSNNRSHQAFVQHHFGSVGNRNNALKIFAQTKVAGDSKSPSYILSNTGYKLATTGVSYQEVKSKHKIDIHLSAYALEAAVLRASHIGNTTDLEAAIKSGQPWYIAPFTYSLQNPKQQVSHISGIYHIKRNPSLLGFWELSQSFQWNKRKEFDLRRGASSNRPALDLDLLTHHADLYYHLPRKSDYASFELGLSTQQAWNTYDANTGALPLIPWYIKSNHAAFALYTQKIRNAKLESGLRFEHLLLQTKNFISNQLTVTNRSDIGLHADIGLSIPFTTYLESKFGIAYAFRPPFVHELYSNGVHHGSAAIERGNDNLKSESSLQTNFALEYNAEIVKFNVQAYYNKLHNYMYLRSFGETELTIRGAFPVFHYVQDATQIFGFDIQAAYKPIKPLQLHSNFSFLRANNISDNSSIPMMPPLKASVGLDYSYKNKTWKLPVFIVMQHVFEQNNVDISKELAAPPEAYTLLNLGFAIQRKFGKSEFGIECSVNNALNTTYRSYLNRFRYFADETGRNIQIKLTSQF